MFAFERHCAKLNLISQLVTPCPQNILWTRKCVLLWRPFSSLGRRRLFACMVCAAQLGHLARGSRSHQNAKNTYINTEHLLITQSFPEIMARQLCVPCCVIYMRQCFYLISVNLWKSICFCWCPGGTDDSQDHAQVSHSTLAEKEGTQKHTHVCMYIYLLFTLYKHKRWRKLEKGRYQIEQILLCSVKVNRGYLS